MIVYHLRSKLQEDIDNIDWIFDDLVEKMVVTSFSCMENLKL